MKEYNSVEQRIIATYLQTLPEYTGSSRSNNIQYDMYCFIKDLLEYLVHNPSELFDNTNKDDAFSNRFNKSSDNKPDLMKNMKKAIMELEKLIKFLAEIRNNTNGSSELFRRKKNKCYASILDKIDIKVGVDKASINLSSDKYRNINDVVSWMSKVFSSKKQFTIASLFDDENFSLVMNFNKLSGHTEQYYRLLEYLSAANYHELTNIESTSLEYLKGKSGIVPQKGGFQYKVNHIGISMNYDRYVKEPASFSICIPSMKRLLTFYDDMGDELKRSIVSITKKCDGCNYCTQTDKSGTRKKANYPVEYSGKKYVLCTYFPGYYYTFSLLNDTTVDCMIDLLKFMDERLDKLLD